MNLTLLELFLHCRSISNQVYLVGGCVRDMMMNVNPKDFDLVTDANLDILNTILIDNGWKVNHAGKNFLVTIVSKNNYQYEVCNFRKDGTYSNGRKPDYVDIGDINTDYIRRDFTCNSLYYDPIDDKILDPSGKGINDIKNKIIRFNGKANDRIKEDYLRIFRCYRQAAVFGFDIDKSALKACRTHFNKACSTLSPERIRCEIEKMVSI